MFMDKPHTLERMRTTAFLPQIADRDPRPQWEEKGFPDSQVHAMKRVRDILTRDNPAVFSPDVDARVRAKFKGLVGGDSVPPSSWKQQVNSQS
jgi:trimethylamine--corrinoid protein Co-methyltransferase